MAGLEDAINQTAGLVPLVVVGGLAVKMSEKMFDGSNNVGVGKRYKNGRGYKNHITKTRKDIKGIEGLPKMKFGGTKSPLSGV